MYTLVTCSNCSNEIDIPILDSKEEYSCPFCNIKINTWHSNYLQIEFEIKKTKNILCIDFGTSSLRAAILGKSKDPEPIEIGKQVQSQIDDLSIPSAVWVSSDGNQIEFGETAMRLGLNPFKYKSSLFEISPKKWLTNGVEILDIDEIISKTKITKGYLISGLISQALFGISKQLEVTIQELRKYEIRISHPIWDKKIECKLQFILEKLLSDAFVIFDKTINGISAKELVSLLGKRKASIVFSKQVVNEPIAAALSLFEDLDNSIAFVVVIDVGAGTTDMAAFYSTKPDPYTSGAISGKYQRQLLSQGKPISLFKAGDLIDDVLIDLLIKKIKTLSDAQKQDIKNRRRTIKESLFKNNKIIEYGAEISYQEISNHPKILDYIDDIRNGFKSIILSCETSLTSRIASNSVHKIDSVMVIFAGGGGKIKFIRNAIGNHITIDGILVDIDIVDITKLNLTHSLIERLAVSLGGTTPKDEWPKVNAPEITSFRGILL